ncbi:MAG: hypothetical protein IJ412_03235 [Oscillospiraceae bacterium]|nr:hypothetical protein [Oscillospiraceae bacterium]
MHEQGAKRRKSKAWLWLLVILPLIYLGVQVWNLSNRPYRTQTAGAVTMTDSISTSGVVVRQETVIPQDTAGVVSYTVKDVQRVSSGTEVARLFDSAYAARSFDAAAQLSQEIALLRQAQTDGVNAGTDVNLILTQVSDDLYDYIEVLQTGRFEGLDAVHSSLNYSLNKLGIAVGREQDYEALLAELQTEYDAQAAQSAAIASVYAPHTGYFFYDADGCEGLTPEYVQSLAPQQLDVLEQTWQRDATPAVGKMVGSYRWYYICAVSAQDAARFTVGRSVTLNFTDAGVTGVAAVVDALGEPDGDGRVVVTLRSEQMEESFSALRFEAAEVQFAAYNGIRISRSAMHINDEGEHGVYIKFGTLVRFRRITPIFETESYLLVPLNADDDRYKDLGPNEVKLFDEIIVEGTDLFDGKLL